MATMERSGISRSGGHAPGWMGLRILRDSIDAPSAMRQAWASERGGDAGEADFGQLWCTARPRIRLTVELVEPSTERASRSRGPSSLPGAGTQREKSPRRCFPLKKSLLEATGSRGGGWCFAPCGAWRDRAVVGGWRTSCGSHRLGGERAVRVAGVHDDQNAGRDHGAPDGAQQRCYGTYSGPFRREIGERLGNRSLIHDRVTDLRVAGDRVARRTAGAGTLGRSRQGASPDTVAGQRARGCAPGIRASPVSNRLGVQGGGGGRGASAATTAVVVGPDVGREFVGAERRHAGPAASHRAGGVPVGSRHWRRRRPARSAPAARG